MITLPTQSCLVLYSFCASLLHSLIMWLIVSSLPPHNLYLMFYCVLSILVLIWLVLMELFCPSFRRDSISLLRFSFFSHVHVFSCQMSLLVDYYYYYYYYYYSLIVSHISVSRWSFTGVWVATSLLKFPRLFSVFWSISAMLYFGIFPLVLLFPSSLVNLPNLWWLYQEHQRQSV